MVFVSRAPYGLLWSHSDVEPKCNIIVEVVAYYSCTHVCHAARPCDVLWFAVLCRVLYVKSCVWCCGCVGAVLCCALMCCVVCVGL